MASRPVTLSLKGYREGISELTSRDRDLAEAVSQWGEPPFWTHPSGFPGMIITILAQQVSLESAEAAYRKLESTIPSVTPELFLSLDDPTLRQVGFSRQKASYVRGIAQAIIAGEVDLEGIESTDDELARKSLVALRGVGPWTADAYLLFSLRRSDAWPSADLALLKAIQDLKGIAATPKTEEADAIADGWRPWRSVAARILWYDYLRSRGRLAES